jgi:hypothetical protein
VFGVFDFCSFYAHIYRKCYIYFYKIRAIEKKHVSPVICASARAYIEFSDVYAWHRSHPDLPGSFTAEILAAPKLARLALEPPDATNLPRSRSSPSPPATKVFLARADSRAQQTGRLRGRRTRNGSLGVAAGGGAHPPTVDWSTSYQAGSSR